MKEKINFYCPAVAAFIAMMAMSLVSSPMSFFAEPICDQLGLGRGSFSLIFSLMTLAGILTNTFIGQYAGKKGVRGILFLTAIWGCVWFQLLAHANSLWLLYGGALMLGFFGSSCVALCGNVIVQQSYDAIQASSMLGLVMAGSGVGGMIFNLLIPGLIESNGWQSAMSTMGLSWLGLLGSAALILGKERHSIQGHNTAAVGLGMTRAEAVKSKQFRMMMVIIITVTAACGIQQQQPSLLASLGFETSQVSLLMALITAGLAVGKVAQGLLYGRLGVRRGGCLMIVCFGAGILCLLNRVLVYPGLILLALGLGVYTTLLPLVTRQVFGTREYAAIWSLLATVGSVGSMAANPLWGGVYDAAGSYAPVQIVMAALLLGSSWVLNRLLKGLR